MTIPTGPYLEQNRTWPSSGRHILASFDDHTIVVYQAYWPTIGEFAIRSQFFGDGFGYNRMSWIKPNFLWMMYRSDWARSVNQEVVLAIRLRRAFFDKLLEKAVPSSFVADTYPTHDEWKRAIALSDVRFQWDPDHHPDGTKAARRALQIGLRGNCLESYGKREALEIVDMRELVISQRENVAENRRGKLIVPIERPYRPIREEIANRIGLS